MYNNKYYIIIIIYITSGSYSFRVNNLCSIIYGCLIETNSSDNTEGTSEEKVIITL